MEKDSLDFKKAVFLTENAYKHFIRMHELYKQIDDLGYEETPPEIYANWLKHISKRKDIYENNRKILLNEIIK